MLLASQFSPDISIAGMALLTGPSSIGAASHQYAHNVLLKYGTNKTDNPQQYEGLEKIYEKYKDQGFEVLGFPCNQFGGQEPGSAEDIQNVGALFALLYLDLANKSSLTVLHV